MKRADFDTRTGQQFRDSSRHFPRGFVGERQSQNLMLANTAFDEPRDSVSYDTRFARTGPGQNRERTVSMFDRCCLFGSQLSSRVVHRPCRLTLHQKPQS